MIKVAMIVANDMKDVEIIKPLFVWNRLDIMVHLVSIEKKSSVLLESGYKLGCTDTIEKVNLSQYNAIYIPGGEGVKFFNFTTWPTKKSDIIKKFLNSLETFIKADDKYLFFTDESINVLKNLKLVKDEEIAQNFNKNNQQLFMSKLNNILVYKGYSTCDDFIIESTKLLEELDNRLNNTKNKKMQKEVIDLIKK